MDKLPKKDIAAVDAEAEAFLAALPMATPHAEGHKKKKKHHKEQKKVDVSINSLLDVLSVILVFLMKSYSTTSVQVKPSKELQVPFTHSANPVEDSTVIGLTGKHVLMNDVPVVTLDNTKVPEADLAHAGLLIQPLFEKLREEVELQRKIAQTNKKKEFKGIVTIISDRHTPFPLLTQAMYTAGQAEFGQFKFVLIKGDRS
jgi:biopolymer transport protein ExbD